MIEISAITARDFQSVTDFLNTHMNQKITPERWMKLFTYPWQEPSWTHGVLAKADNKIVGVWPCLHGIDSAGNLISNPSSFYIHQDYRGQSIASKMMEQLSAQVQGGMILLSVSPNAEKIYQHWGFQPLEYSRYQYRRDSIHKNFPKTTPEKATNKEKRGKVSPYLQSLADFHQEMGCRCHWLEAGGISELFVMKSFISKSQTQYSELIHASNYSLLETNGVELTSVLMDKDDQYMNVDSRFFRKPPTGFIKLSLPAPRYFRSKLNPQEIQLSFTEVPLLAIRP